MRQSDPNTAVFAPVSLAPKRAYLCGSCASLRQCASLVFGYWRNQSKTLKSSPTYISAHRRI
jgi:hypothetical protein